MLQTIQLTKRYEDGQLALDSLNLEIKAGEIFFLLGANGARQNLDFFAKLVSIITLYFPIIPSLSNRFYLLRYFLQR